MRGRGKLCLGQGKAAVGEGSGHCTEGCPRTGGEGAPSGHRGEQGALSTPGGASRWARAAGEGGGGRGWGRLGSPRPLTGPEGGHTPGWVRLGSR